MTLLLACVATFSKGALLLGLPVGIALVLLLGARRSGRRWPLWVLGGAVLAGLAGLMLLFRTPRFADLFNFETGTSFLRVRLWQAAWQMALDHPLLGVGPDNFLYAYRSHYVLPAAWEELNLSHPHNLLLDLWTRLGLVGVLAGLYALAVAFRSAWRSFRRGSAYAWPLALGLLAGLAATVLHGLIDNSLFLPDLMGPFVIALWVQVTGRINAYTDYRRRGFIGLAPVYRLLADGRTEVIAMDNLITSLTDNIAHLAG